MVLVRAESTVSAGNTMLAMTNLRTSQASSSSSGVPARRTWMGQKFIVELGIRCIRQELGKRARH